MGPNMITNESRSVGSVDGLSSLMKRTEEKSVEIPQLIDDGEPYRNFSEIKEVFMTKCFTFEDLLQLMGGKSKPGSEQKIYLADF